MIITTSSNHVSLLKQFKNSSLQNYGLCPGHYCKILHMTKFELEFTGDLDIYLSFEKAVKGRVFDISSRYSKTISNTKTSSTSEIRI